MEALVKLLANSKCRSLLDFGAGEGRYVRALHARGVEALGIDGTPQIEHMTNGLVVEADLTEPLTIEPADAGLSLEVGEHLQPSKCSCYVDSMVRLSRRLLVVSWATPGQRGRGHINCLPPEYVAARIVRRGMSLDESATTMLRESAPDWSRKIMVFARCTASSH